MSCGKQFSRQCCIGFELLSIVLKPDEKIETVCQLVKYFQENCHMVRTVIGRENLNFLLN